MDFTPIIAQVWGTLGWVIPLMLLIGLLKSPWAKGHIGELLAACRTFLWFSAMIAACPQRDPA
jgi:hypothetical protein